MGISRKTFNTANEKMTMSNSKFKTGNFDYGKGSMAIIGRNKAVLDFSKPKMHFKDFIAFIAWIFIHVIWQVTFRNRIKTFSNWVAAYFAIDQSPRMIIRPSARLGIKRRQRLYC